MLAKSGSSLIFYAHYVESKVGKTGLTVTVDVWEVQRDGTAAEIVTGGSATEIGDGLYRYLLAAGSVDDSAEYIAVFKTATTTVDQQDLPALWVVDRTVDADVAGTGAIEWPYTLLSDVDSSPITDADVWVTSDLAGLFTIASGRTDQNGVVTFYLDAGTVYVWRQKSGWDFTNPDTETVVAP